MCELVKVPSMPGLLVFKEKIVIDPEFSLCISALSCFRCLLCIDVARRGVISIYVSHLFPVCAQYLFNHPGTSFAKRALEVRKLDDRHRRSVVADTVASAMRW